MLPLQLQPESHVPLYIQVRDQIRALVHTGELRVGDRIPASRELAAHLGVHRTTVANAYAELESEGLIQGHVGRGTFVLAHTNGGAITPPPPATRNGSVRWETLFADERGEEVLSRLMPAVPRNAISFAAAKPDAQFFLLEEFRNCCNAVLKSEGARILQIGSSDGYAPLKESLRSVLRDDGVTARDDQLLVTSGCQQSLDLLCKAFLRPGDSVILENPAYPGAMAIFAGARVHCLAVPVHGSMTRQGFAGLDVEALEIALLQNRVKLIVLTPDFQNPTGTSLPLAARRRVLEVAGKHQVPVVEDHIYARLRFRASRLPSLKALDRHGIVIQIDSFSKVAFPGLRVGWVVAPENVIERLRLVKQATDLHTDQLAQAALAEFTRRGLLARHLTRMRKVYCDRMEAMTEALERHMPDGTTWTRPEGGMCLWVSLPPGMDASELLLHVRERGVLFAPGRYFYFQNPVPNTLRLAFSSQDEKQTARGVHILGEVLRAELRKRQRGVRSFDAGRVAFV
jgi:DNA-binding transcriptional MocR family regulator